MAEITFNNIFDGVSLALHRAYPAPAQIHGRTVKQNLRPGDFNVLPISTNHAAQLGPRAKRSITFDVIYYPTDEGGRAECLDKANALPEVLTTITTPNGDKVHCTGFEYTIEDDVLHCIVSYPHFVQYEAEVGDLMETLITR